MRAMTSVRRRARGVAASRAVMMHSSPLRDDRFIVMDVSTARAIADALRTAGTRAGATGDVAARGDASSAATLAATCHEKMRFDFPSVRAREVRALARAMRDRLREDDVGEATREFPVTTALARNCAEEASREMARASELGGAGGDADADEATPTKDDDDESVEARAKAYASLCVVVFVEFPRRVLAMGDEDAFEALRAYSPPDEPEIDASTREDAADATTTNGVNGVKHSTPRVDLPDDEDDEDDWEPLETTETWFNFTEDARFANATKREVVDAKIRGLLHELLPSRVGATMRGNVGMGSDWERLKIADGVLALFEALCGDEDPGRRALRTVPLRVLRERWSISSGSAMGVDAGLARVLRALQFGREASYENEDQSIALELLAHLCLQCSAESIGVSPRASRDERAAHTTRGKLWAHAHTAVPVITATLERSARVMDARKEESEWQENVGLCAIILSFYCVNASASTIQSVGDRILRSGCLRAIVNVFIGVREYQCAEAVRRALLLMTLACEAVYDFTSRVPTVLDAVRGKSFDARGPYAGHGAMWKVALRESDAETHLARCLDRFAVSMDDEADVCALRETIMLTRACDAAARLGGRTLFTPGGEVTEALKRLNTRVVEVMSAMTRERDGIARAEKGDVDEDEKKRVENPKAPDVEKRRDVVVDIGRKLKALLLVEDSVTVVRKSD